MPKVQIDLPEDVYNSLKIDAKKYYQSLKAHIQFRLVEQIRNPQLMIDTSVLPEGTTATIKTKVAKPLTQEEKLKAFQKRAKEILGRELDEVDDYRIMDYDYDHEYYIKEYEKPLTPGSAVHCVYVYDLPEDKQIGYLNELHAYELRHRRED